MDDDDDEQMVEDCLNRGGRLTTWEADFCTSLADRLQAGRELTARQREVLSGVWERVTARG